MRRAPAALLGTLLLLAPAALAAGAAAEYEVFYSERASRFASEGLAAEGETRGFRFVVAQENVTRVEFVLTWTETGDGAGLSGPDVLSLRAEDPQGRPVETTTRSTTGEIRLVASPVNPLPRDGPVAADELDAHLAATTGREGQGEWRAWVKLEDAGNPRGARFDESNRFQLVALIHHYEGVPMRVVSLEKPPMAGLAGEEVPLAWKLAMGGLAACAGALAVAIVSQWRKRGNVRLSPDGENAPPSGR